MSEGISLEELQLAARNHAMPLEALKWEITPVGLHYLLIHYDIPLVDPEVWRLEIDGLVDKPLATRSTTCARGRRSKSPPRWSAPGTGGRTSRHTSSASRGCWEAVGNARWKGVALAPLLEEAGVREGAVEVLFEGPIAGSKARRCSRTRAALPLQEAMREDVLLAYEVNGGRCRRSTASRSGCSCQVGTG